MTEKIITSLAISLILTITLEIVFFLLARKRDKKDLLLVILVNVLTNPVVVLLYWLTTIYTKWNIWVALIPLELFAILTEGRYYKKYGNAFKHPFFFSLCANMFSYWIGVVLQLFI